MRIGVQAAVLLTMLAAAPRAQADSPSPNQQLCELEIQQRDGSQCLACQYGRMNEDQQLENCGTALARGYTERCAFGGMWVRAVYCDRTANFVQVARGPVAPAASADTASSEPTSTESPAAEPASAESASVAETAPSASTSGDSPSPATDDVAPETAEPSRSEPESAETTTGSRSDSSAGCSVAFHSRSAPTWLLALLALAWFRRPREGRPHAP